MPQLTEKQLKLKGHAPAKPKEEILANELADMKDRHVAQQAKIALKEATLN